MALLTGFILIDILAVTVAIFAVIYAYFQWTYLTWKRKNVPFFQPTFPLGNKQPLNKLVSLGEDIFLVVQEAKRKGN